MPRENLFTLTAARVARIPFALLADESFKTPEKVLFLQTCCLSQVMLATPLLAVLQESFPKARFDWAVSDWARAAIVSNPRLTEVISIGGGDLRKRSWGQIGDLVKRLRREYYDTCFIVSRSGLLSYIAWQAGISQRIGLNDRSRGFAHTVAVRPPQELRNAAEIYLSLAEAVGIEEEKIKAAGSEFYPPDRDRLAMTQLLVEEMDWLGDVPLVIMHPGGGVNPVMADPLKRWPVERFALLGNHLVRHHGARIVLVGAEEERGLAEAISGLIATKLTNLCGRVSLGEVGALCEVADLYIGNDAGPSHIAAAAGCSTLVIYGPSDPGYSKPFSTKADVIALWRDLGEVEKERPFTWDIGVTVEQAIEVADELVEKSADRSDVLAILAGGEK
jgi:lipopolysaccharide heptosyltransferase II